MNFLPLTNRADSGAYQLPEDGFYPLVPSGEYPARAGKQRLIQVLDQASLTALANRFEAEAKAPGFAGLLVDFDHFSQDLDKPTRAAGWITALANREAGLFAEIRWTGPGQQAVESGEYRFLSPVFDLESAENLGGGRVRPTRLLNVGLTNDPNLKTLRPISNRNQNQENPAVNEAILKQLGLPADAAEDKVAEAITALRNRADKADKAEADLATLRKQQLEAQVEKDLDEHKAAILNRDEVKKQLLANRDATLSVLKSLKPAADKPAIPNRRQGTVPATDPGDAEDGGERRKASAIRNRAAEIQRDQKVNFTTAWNLAQQELA